MSGTLDAGLAVATASAAARGSRFITRFESRSHLHRLHPNRVWRLAVGLSLLAFGIVNVFIPGPGGSVIILGSLLVLAGESRLLARLLDTCELRFGRQVDWALRHKLLAACIVSGTAFAAVLTLGYVVTQLR